MTGVFKEKRTIVSSSLDHLDALLDNDVAILGVRRGGHGRQQSQVDAKGLVGHGAATTDLIAQVLRRRLGQGSQDSETTGVGDSRGELSSSDLCISMNRIVGTLVTVALCILVCCLCVYVCPARVRLGHPEGNRSKKGGFGGFCCWSELNRSNYPARRSTE